MSIGKVKGAKVKVHAPPDGTGTDGSFHVYVYDVFNKAFLPGKAYETIEKAAAFQRSEQERIYTEQEAEPDLFDLPFISTDPDLIARIERNADYKTQLMKELVADIRSRSRGR